MKQTKAETERIRFNQLLEFQLDSEIASLKADFLLEEVEGQLALRIAYWFLITHGDVIEDSITGEVKTGTGAGSKSNDGKAGNKNAKQTENSATGSDVKPRNDSKHDPGSTKQASGDSKSLKISPGIRTSMKSVNFIHDFHYVNRYRTFDEVSL